MALSKNAIAALAGLGVDYATAYNSLAQTIALDLSGSKLRAAEAKESKKTVWDHFKDSLTVAQEEGHTVTALRVGMEIACSNAGIPSGSFRSYIATISDLYTDIQAEELTIEEAQVLTITEARQRYKVESPLQQMHAKLKALTKDWELEQMALLLNIIGDMTSSEMEAQEEAETVLDAYPVAQAA